MGKNCAFLSKETCKVVVAVPSGNVVAMFTVVVPLGNVAGWFTLQYAEYGLKHITTLAEAVTTPSTVAVPSGNVTARFTLQ